MADHPAARPPPPPRPLLASPCLPRLSSRRGPSRSSPHSPGGIRCTLLSLIFGLCSSFDQQSRRVSETPNSAGPPHLNRKISRSSFSMYLCVLQRGQALVHFLVEALFLLRVG